MITEVLRCSDVVQAFGFVARGGTEKEVLQKAVEHGKSPHYTGATGVVNYPTDFGPAESPSGPCRHLYLLNPIEEQIGGSPVSTLSQRHLSTGISRMTHKSYARTVS